ncbi:hypothetical protein [Roseovarius sp. C03]|uniref:hypothetical protein n=1 Tax=Roseovarius sp. C03 TaxID=3449222 RepID=UPI003EDBC6A1
MNDIQTWQQGQFAPVSGRPVAKATAEKHDREERHLVRPGLRENAICRCPRPEDAAWIAQRLNLASKLERMAYDFATGKTDGDEIVRLVRAAVD